MKFHPAKCPNCSGSLQIPDDKDVVKCTYCNEDVFVREVIKVIVNSNIPGWLRLAKLAEISNNYEEAKSYYKKIIEFEPNNTDAWLKLAKLAESTKNYEEAKSYYKMIFEYDPKNTVVLNILAESAETRYNMVEAILYYKTITEFEPKNSKAWFKYAYCLTYDIDDYRDNFIHNDNDKLINIYKVFSEIYSGFKNALSSSNNDSNMKIKIYCCVILEGIAIIEIVKGAIKDASVNNTTYEISKRFFEVYKLLIPLLEFVLPFNPESKIDVDYFGGLKYDYDFKVTYKTAEICIYELRSLFKDCESRYQNSFLDNYNKYKNNL